MATGERWHVLASSVTGVVGGFGGALGTLADLPATTTLILRSIQEIAVQHGEDLENPEVRGQCVAVFGLSSPIHGGENAGAGLWASRLALSGQAVAAIIRAVVPSFGVMVSDKLLAQAAPILGALAGGVINPIFTDYYQTMAHVHIRLRRMERKYNADRIRIYLEQAVQTTKAAEQAATLALTNRLPSI